MINFNYAWSVFVHNSKTQVLELYAYRNDIRILAKQSKKYFFKR